MTSGVIGYTPDVVISHWLGFPTTDESHYLAGSTSNGAAHVFRKHCKYHFTFIRQEVPLQSKMLISKMELAPANTRNQVQSNEENQTDDTLSDIRSRAQNLVDEASRAISDAKIKEKAQTIWDSVVNLFR